MGDPAWVFERPVRRDRSGLASGQAQPAGQDFFSSWPPKPLRIAESTLLAKSSRPREAKREYIEAVSTGAGTPSLIALRPPPTTIGLRRR